MSAFIDFLKDKAGNVKYPRTLFKAVFDDDNNRLDNVISAIKTSLQSLSNNVTEVSEKATTNANNYNNLVDSLTSKFKTLDADMKAIEADVYSNTSELETVNNTIDSMALVATTGSYNDLTNKPTIPTVYSGTADPSSSTGKNGDIYFKYES